MATLSKRPQSEVMVEMPTKMAKASKKKIIYSPSKKGRKRSIPSTVTMFKGVYKLMATKAVTFLSRSNVLVLIRQTILNITHTIRSLVSL